jgi:hypothetical protein
MLVSASANRWRPPVIQQQQREEEEQQEQQPEQQQEQQHPIRLFYLDLHHFRHQPHQQQHQSCLILGTIITCDTTKKLR